VKLSELDIEIDPGGTLFTVTELAALLPDLRIGIAPVLERSSPRFATRIEVHEDDSESARMVARHLAKLREFSKQHPDVAITITAGPDGGALRLRGGSFGDDEDELETILGSIADDQHWRVYVAFRIERDAHDHVLDLVTRALGSVALVSEPSDTSLAIGLDVDGNAARIADLISNIRLAWRQEGSEIECLVEVEGAIPIVEVVRTWAEWEELERRLRRTVSEINAADVSRAWTQERTDLGDAPGTGELLGAANLSWIDADDQVLAIENGRLFSLSERVEAGDPYIGEIRRRGGSLYFTRKGKRVDLPRAPDHTERRFHGVSSRGALFTDTSGTGTNATTQLLLVNGEGVLEGPKLERVRSLEASADEVFALAEGAGGVALFAMELGKRWGYTESRPWRQGEVPTDLGIFSNSRVAITAQRGARSVLYLVERANLVYARVLALPCIEPQISAIADGTVWITGVSPPPAPARCDLFRVDSTAGMVTLVTAELDATTLEVVAKEAGRALIATDRSVYVTTAGALRELVQLASDEEVSGMIDGPTSVVFIRGPLSSRIILGHGQAIVPLETPGYAPLF
jgi:hypothetical protein